MTKSEHYNNYELPENSLSQEHCWRLQPLLLVVYLTSLSNLTFPSPQNLHLARTVDLTLNCAFVNYCYTCLIRMVEQC